MLPVLFLWGLKQQMESSMQYLSKQHPDLLGFSKLLHLQLMMGGGGAQENHLARSDPKST